LADWSDINDQLEMTMTTAVDKTISATEFKAKCLELMAQVHNGQLRRLHITKRGKPFVAVTLDDDASKEPWRPESIFGCMKGTINLPDDFDWEQSPFTDAELAEQAGRFSEKFQHLL
jgi:hemin uptake protein HemP